ncbi:MAG: hypothetical protein WA584_02630 [Pyrinomonadaceae bacterium]
MSSIKCEACGLYNFKTMESCQRCGQTLGNAAVAAQMSYQTSIQNAPVFPTQPMRQSQPAPTAFQNNQAPYQSYSNQTAPYQQPYQPQFNPPPPPQFHDGYGYQEQPFQQAQMPMLCVKCGDRQSVYMQYFKKEYVPPVAYLALLMGFLPGAIIIALSRVKHDINAPFCLGCWDKFSKVNRMEALGTVGFVLGIIFGIIAMMITQSGFALLVCLAAGFSALVWSQIFKSKYSPKYKTVTRKQVVIDAPSVGDMRFVRDPF